MNHCQGANYQHDHIFTSTPALGWASAMLACKQEPPVVKVEQENICPVVPALVHRAHQERLAFGSFPYWNSNVCLVHRWFYFPAADISQFVFVLFLPLLEILNRAVRFQLSLYKSAVSRNTWFMCLHPASLLTAAACLGCWWLSIKISTKRNRGRFVYQHQHTHRFLSMFFFSSREERKKSERLLGLYFQKSCVFLIFPFFH